MTTQSISAHESILPAANRRISMPEFELGDEMTNEQVEYLDTYGFIRFRRFASKDLVRRLVEEEHTPAEIGELLIAFELTTEQLRGYSDTVDGKLYEIGDRLKDHKGAGRVES